MIKRKPVIFLIALLYPWLAKPVIATGTIESYKGSLEQPGITLQDLDHGVHTLADYRGKVVLINFWASWCVPCITEMPGMQRLADRLTDQDFEILAVNVSDPENRIREFLRRMELRLTVLMDRNGDTFKAWQGKVLPASFLLDRSGRIRYRVIGSVEWDSDDAGKIIQQLIQQQ